LGSWIEALRLHVNFIGRHGHPPGEEPIAEVPSVEFVAGGGLREDRFLDHKVDYKGQITFFAREVDEGLCNQLSICVIRRGSDLKLHIHDKVPEDAERPTVILGPAL
jgi:hypothetical protein